MNHVLHVLSSILTTLEIGSAPIRRLDLIPRPFRYTGVWYKEGLAEEHGVFWLGARLSFFLTKRKKRNNELL